MNSSTRRNSRSFQFDSLESRQLMSGDPLGISVSGNVLKVTGSANNDSIVVTQSVLNWTVTNGSWRRSYFGAFAGLSVDAKGGNDSIAFRSSGFTPATLNGSTGNDTLVGASGNDLLIGGAGNDRELGLGGFDWLYGSAGNDSLDGGSASDNLYGGSGDDLLVGGLGDDVIVSIGGGNRDSLFGSGGVDSFWTDSDASERMFDASSVEFAGSAIHRIASFQSEFGFSVSKELNGQDLADPYLAGDAVDYRYYGGHELFGTFGPTINDINQGSIGDCYFLSQLASYAMVNPQIIRQSVVDLGDGTFAVRFQQRGRDAFYRVDGDLPVNRSGALSAAGLGADGSVWVAVMEKAWTFARTGDGDYASIEGGWMDEVARALGHSATRSLVPSNGQRFFDLVSTALANGESVTVGTYGTVPRSSPMVEGHAYTVVGVWTDPGGARWLIVRNPWGIDNETSRDGANDGYVTISASEAIASLDEFVIAQA